MEKKIESFDGTKINYDIHRVSDRFLVFLHGAGGDLRAWDKHAKFFRKRGFSTVAVDLRGHGKSGRPLKPSDYSIRNFAKDIHTIIKKERIKDFVVVGHCFGGMITIMFHKLFPGLAKSYILVATSYKPHYAIKMIFRVSKRVVAALNYILERMNFWEGVISHRDYSKYVGTSDYDIKRILSDIRHTSIRSFLFMYENMSKFNALKVLRTIKKDVLIIQGEKDSIFRIPIAMKMKKVMKGSQIRVVPDANHLLVLNNPKELNREIIKFLSRIE